MTFHSKKFELLVASESTSYNACTQSHEATEELFLFEYVKKNPGFVEIESDRQEINSNNYFMIPPGIKNKYWSKPGVIQEKIFFICKGELVTSLLKVYNLECAYLVREANSVLKYFFNMLLLNKQYGSNKDREAAIVFHKLLQAANAVLYKDEQSYLPPAVEKLRNLLDKHVEDKIDFSLINKELAYSQAYMVRLFKEHMGVTPHEYVLRRRLETAQLLLKHSTLSIKEIAERLVFSDQYHFSNYFRKRLGMSPSQYRKGE